MIVDWLLAHASALGARRAFLFTTNARAYFEGLGFEVVDRSRAPQSILTTRQAAGLCPASATLLTHTVTPLSWSSEREHKP
jgi:N-acetylglutamate synthase-like GNAT family acetyltransferase